MRSARRAAACYTICWHFALVFAVSTVFAARPAGETGKDWGDPAGQECVECHWTENPDLTQEWNNSQHGQAGGNCLDCHSEGVIVGHYKQFDDVVELYNEKLAKPTAAVMGELKKADNQTFADAMLEKYFKPIDGHA